MESTEETAELVERVAALDIGKATLMACIRVPHEHVTGRRRQEVAEYPTTTGALLRLADRLREFRVTRIAMEATSDYGNPGAFSALLAAERDAPQEVRYRPWAQALTRDLVAADTRDALPGVRDFASRIGVAI